MLYLLILIAFILVKVNPQGISNQKISDDFYEHLNKLKPGTAIETDKQRQRYDRIPVILHQKAPSKFQLKNAKIFPKITPKPKLKYVPKFSPLFPFSMSTPTASTARTITTKYPMTSQKPKSMTKFTGKHKFSPIHPIAVKTVTSKDRKKLSNIPKFPRLALKNSGKFSPLYPVILSDKTEAKTTRRLATTPVTKKPTKKYRSIRTFKPNLAAKLLKGTTLYRAPKSAKKPPSGIKAAKGNHSSLVNTSTEAPAPEYEIEQFEQDLAAEASDSTLFCLKDMSLNYRMTYQSLNSVVGLARRYSSNIKLKACLVIGNTYQAGINTMKGYYHMRYMYVNWLEYEVGYLVHNIIQKYQSLIELYYIAYTRLNADTAPYQYMFYMYRTMTKLGTVIIHLCNMLQAAREKKKEENKDYDNDYKALESKKAHKSEHAFDTKEAEENLKRMEQWRREKKKKKKKKKGKKVPMPTRPPRQPTAYWELYSYGWDVPIY